MEKKYELLKVPELNGIREVLTQVGNDPKYSVINKLYAYIKENGAVRSDVYEYLCENMCFQEYSLLILNNLVKNNAGPEWFDLIKQTEEREHEGDVSKANIRLFQQLVLDAYRENIPASYVADAFGKARYPYEVNQRIEQYQNSRYNEMSEVMSGLRVVMEELQHDRQKYVATCEQMETVLKEKNKVICNLREQMETVMDKQPEETESKTVVVTEPEEDEIVPQTDTEEEIPENAFWQEDYNPEEDFREEFDSPETDETKESTVPPNLGMPQTTPTELKKFMEEMKKEAALQRKATLDVLNGMNEMFTNMMGAMFATRENVSEQVSMVPEIEPETESEQEPTAPESEAAFVGTIEQVQEQPASKTTPVHKEETQSEAHGVLVTEKRESRDVAKRVNFFQKIREKKRQSDFEKLSNTKKLEALFRMMTERNFNDTLMIMAKTCLDLDVSFEFLYGFIEMGAGEEEFRKLILFRNKEQHPNETISSNMELDEVSAEIEGGIEF